MSNNKRSNRELGFCWLVLSLLLVVFPVRSVTSSWTKLTNLAPASPGTMMLLSDGTVMVQNNNNLAGWMRLKPDIHGSYINGTWAQDIKPMNLARLYFASNVLSSGKVWVLGGEYSGTPLSQNITPMGEIWDPLTNVWSLITPYPSGFFGDDPSMLLPGGRILAGDIFSNQSQIYDIATNTWSPAGNKVYDDRSDEESWAKLGNGSVLTYDIFQTVGTGKGYAEVYNPSTNAWSSISPADGSAGGVLPVLTSSAIGFELGETTVEITPAEDSNLSFIPSFVTRMLTLPTGQVLFVDSSEQLWVYTGDGRPNPALRPVVNKVVYNGGGIFTLTGKLLNGQSAAAGYGDDAEGDENYPLVRLMSSTGNVYYCRTSNWSTVGVDGGATLQTVNFTLNRVVTAGNYALTVVGAAIPSLPVFVNIKQSEVDGL